MEIIYLDEDTVDIFTEYLGEDEAENIQRMYYRGFVVREDDKPVAGIIWQLRNVMSEEEKESRIVFLKIGSDEAEDILFENYRNSIAGEEVKRSTVVLPALSSEREKAALKRAGFGVELMESDIIKARLSEAAKLAIMKKPGTDQDIMPLSSLSQGDFAAAIRRFAQKGLYGTCEDLIYLPKTYFENDMSCYAAFEGQINAMLLFHKLPSGSLSVIMMAFIGDDFHKKILPYMMHKALSSALEHYSPDTEIMIDRHNYTAMAISEKLFPGGFGIPVYQGSRSEDDL